MLFNSYPFLFIFLPVALLGYQVAGHFHRKAVVLWLGFASLAFYAYWRPPLVLLLLASIATNYLAALLISRHLPNRVPPRLWLTLAILLNLGTLGFYKYLFPVLNFTSRAAGSSHTWSNVILPLGISFFTFTQIAYLVDLYQGTATQQDLPSYILFVTFFPHLIAGPILHHKEMMPQFQQNRRYQLRLNDVVVGLSWFIMGLGKKVLIADTFQRSVGLAYQAPGTLSAALAWRGVLCYALQLYFDFSGYSDMALGLARMFSIDFPLNFSSPYKATNIIEFWQRWHITLTQYITAYIYSPIQFWVSGWRQSRGLKVSRKAQATPQGFAAMVALPMIFTMFVAGLWHGAGLQFIVFGLLHGFYLTVNHAWNLFRPKPQSTGDRPPYLKRLSHVASVLLTFSCVLVAQTFFRAGSSRQALSVLAAMLGGHHSHAKLFPNETSVSAATELLEMAMAFFVVWALPNTQQILSRFKPSLHLTPWDDAVSTRGLLWVPTLRWAVMLGCVFFLALVRLQDPSTFLYFQF